MKKTSDTDRHKGHCFITPVSQANVKTIKRFLSSGLKCNLLCLIVHAFSRSRFVSQILYGKQNNNSTTVEPLCRQQNCTQLVCVSYLKYERMSYPDNVKKIHWLMRSCSSQQNSKFTAKIASKNVTQVRTKDCKIRSINFDVNLNLRSLSYFGVLVTIEVYA